MRTLLGAAVGLGVGLLTQWLQGELPDAVGPLANSGAVWVLVAFLLVVAGPPVPVRVGIATAAATMAAETAGYYLGARITDTAFGTSIVVVWIGTAVVAGVVFGTAGAWVRGPHPLRHALGLALVAALLAGEGLRSLLFLPSVHPLVPWAMVLAGALVPVFGRDRRARLTAWAAATPMVAAALGSFWLLDQVILNR